MAIVNRHVSRAIMTPSGLIKPMRMTTRPLLALALLVSALCLLGIKDWLPSAWQFLFWALWLLGAALLLRRVSLDLFGPVFAYDLVRSSRRGMLIGHRCLYAAVLLVILYFVYSSWFPVRRLEDLLASQGLSIADQAKFAEAFFAAFMFVQFAAVCLFTPLYTAGAITDEKERRTIEFLLVTELSSREIVLGMLASRISKLLLLILTGLPVLGFLQFMGGVDPNLVLLGFVATVSLVVSLASVSMYMSVWSDTTVGAIAQAYLLSLAPVVLSIQFGGLAMSVLMSGSANLLGSWPQLIFGWLLFPALHGVIAFVCCRWAIKQFRATALRRIVRTTDQPRRLVRPNSRARARPVDEEAWLPAVIAVEPQTVPSRPSIPPRKGRRPAVGADGLLWKEMHEDNYFHPSSPSGMFPALVATVILVPIFFFMFLAASWMSPWMESERVLRVLTRGCGIFLNFVLLGVIAISAATRVSKEREKQTLDSLFLIPAGRPAILFAKWLGSLLTVRWLWWVVLGLWVLGAFVGGVNPFAVPLLIGAGIVYAAFTASLGLWFSTICKSSLRAILLTCVVLVFLLLNPGLANYMMIGTPLFTSPDGEVSNWPEVVLNYCLTPLGSLWALSFSSADLVKEESSTKALARLLAALAGLHVYLAAAVCLWYAALARLTALKGPVAKPKISVGEHTKN